MKEPENLEDVVNAMFGRCVDAEKVFGFPVKKDSVRIDRDGTLYAERVMTPAEFEEKMWRIKILQDSTPEYNHIDADRLICELLTDLGYGRRREVLQRDGEVVLMRREKMNENNEAAEKAEVMFDWEAEKRALERERAILEADRTEMRRYIATLEGEIKGLKFAIRCDGVSGAEVSAND